MDAAACQAMQDRDRLLCEELFKFVGRHVFLIACETYPFLVRDSREKRDWSETSFSRAALVALSMRVSRTLHERRATFSRQFLQDAPAD